MDALNVNALPVVFVTNAVNAVFDVEFSEAHNPPSFIVRMTTGSDANGVAKLALTMVVAMDINDPLTSTDPYCTKVFSVDVTLASNPASPVSPFSPLNPAAQS